MYMYIWRFWPLSGQENSDWGHSVYFQTFRFSTILYLQSGWSQTERDYNLGFGVGTLCVQETFDCVQGHSEVIQHFCDLSDF